MDNNAKLRPLYLAKILYECTDEDHYLTTMQLAQILEEEYGIPAHRQTIKTDIELLQQFGMDIQEVKSTQNRYNLISRQFEIAELKLLIDAVQSSKFISKERSEQMVSKIVTLAGQYKAEKLKRNASVEGRAKSENRQDLLIVDAINEAINARKKIAFQYFAYNIRKQKKLRHDGERYIFSPYRLIWNGDYYYVLGYSDKHQAIGSFRVDRISARPDILSEEAVPVPADFGVDDFLATTFRMYGSECQEVELICDNSVIDAIIDRFGTDVTIYACDMSTFRVIVRVAISHIFFSWIFGFGGKVRIKGPEKIKTDYKEMVSRALSSLLHNNIGISRSKIHTKEVKTMQERNMPPYAPVLMQSTRAIGYSLEAAIADIIDNSIAAKAGKVQLSFFPVGDAYVSILDNGTGMDDAQMNIAMQYGSKSPTETRDSSDLGRYGLGLKTASLSQCRVLTVISKQGDQVIGRRWDLDYVIKTGAWSLLILDKEDFASVPHISDLYEQDSGTLVVWQNLDRLLMGEVDYEKSLGRKMDEVRQHLELVFHRYLSGESGIKKLEIVFNGVKLKAADPFLIKKSTQAMDTETLVIRGKRILVTPYILPHISKMTEEEKNQLGGKDGIRKRQGFYVYRNKRLLIWGTWFRMMRQGDLSKLARVMVDIPNDLDDLWTLDIKKSHAIPPAEVRNSLQTVIDRIADKSKRTWTFRGKKETSDSVEHMWTRLKTPENGIVYEINRDHVLVDQIVAEAPEIRGKLETLLKYIERGIPLNQLYIDLNNDEKIENDADMGEQEMFKTLEQMLSVLPSSIMRREMLEKIEHTDPFCGYPDVIRALKAKEDGNVKP